MSFDRQSEGMFDYGDTGTALPDPDRIIRRARRRRAGRLVGAVGTALAVAAIAVVVTEALPRRDRAGLPAAAPAPATTPLVPPAPPPAVTPSPSATVTAEPPAVRVVAQGEHVQVYPGTELWVTGTLSCVSHQYPGEAPDAGSTADCRDSDSDNLQGPPEGRRNLAPVLAVQSSWTRGEPLLLTGIYLGRVAPARIVAIDHGKQTAGTIVTTTGMDGWAAFYVVLPDRLPDMHTARPTGSPAGRPTGAQTGLSLASYDADGNLLADLPVMN